jgi:hypothetical protein
VKGERMDRPRVTPKVKVAIKYLIEVKDSLKEAAAHANMRDTAALRLALERPHVLQYLKAQRRVAIAAACAGNPAILRAIRDATDGNAMARVKAIQVLEELRIEDEAPGRSGHLPMTAGLVIHINTGPQPRVIEHGPAATINLEGPDG